MIAITELMIVEITTSPSPRFREASVFAKPRNNWQEGNPYGFVPTRAG